MKADITFSNSSVTNALADIARVESTLCSSIDEKIKNFTQQNQQFSIQITEYNIDSTTTVKHLDEKVKAAADNLQSKRDEMASLFQSKLKTLQLQKSEEEKNLQKETVVLSEITNKMQHTVDKQNQLKEKMRGLLKRERSVSDQATLELLTRTLQVYFAGDCAENETKGFVKLKNDIIPFQFKKEETTRKGIVEKLWDMIELS